MTGDAHLGLRRHRRDAFQEIIGALPEGFVIDDAGAGQRQVPGHGFLVVPAIVDRVSAARYFFQSRHAGQAHHIVLDAADAGGGAVAQVVLERLDLAVALGALAQHDAGMPFLVDIGGLQQHAVHDLDLDLVAVGDVQHHLQLVHRGIKALRIGNHGPRADGVQAKARHPCSGLIGEGAELMTQPRLQRRQRAVRFLWCGFGDGQGACRGGGAGDGEELAAVHVLLLSLLGVSVGDAQLEAVQ